MIMIKILFGVIRRTRNFAADPGVVESAIEAAKSFHGSRDHHGRVAGLGNINFSKDGLAASFTNQFDGLVTGRFRHIHDEDARTFPRHRKRRRAADPGTCAGDQRGLSIEHFGHDSITSRTIYPA
jgi:hypothetical protein